MPESLRNLILSVTITLPGGARIPVPTDSYFKSADVQVIAQADSRAVMATCGGTITLYEADIDDPRFIPFLETLFFAVGQNFGLEMQWKFDDGKPLSDAPLYLFDVLKVRPDFVAGGTIYTLEMGPKGGTLALAATAKGPHTGFASGTRITDIVRTLATDYGWKTQINSGSISKSTIEDSKTVLKEEAQIINNGHIDFISGLRGKVVNDRGRPYLFFFDQAGAIHFHSDTYFATSTKSYTFRDVDGEILSFSVDNDSIRAAFAGGGNAEYIGSDAASGTFSKVTATVKSGLDVSQINAWAGATYVVEAVKDATRKAVIVRTRAELQDIATAEYNKRNASTFKMRLEVLGTHDLIPCGFVTINRLRLNGTLHYVSGDYFIVSLHHSLSGNRWTTNAEGQRQGNLQPDAVTQAAIAVVTKLSALFPIKSVPFSGNNVNEKTAVTV